MIKLLKKKKVTPEIDEYISQRYEDTAVTIYFSIQEGRGIYSAFVPWIQSMLVKYITSDELRDKHWHDQVPLYYNTTLRVNSQAWTEPAAGIVAENRIGKNASSRNGGVSKESSSPKTEATIVPILAEHSGLLQLSHSVREEQTIRASDNILLNQQTDNHNVKTPHHRPHAESKLCLIL